MPEGCEEIARRITVLARAKIGSDAAAVLDVKQLPGHAGFSYSFTLERPGPSGEAPLRDKLVLRLAPPGVRVAGTADVARQGRVMMSLANTPVPVPEVIWVGGEIDWFGRPYYVIRFVKGDKLVMGEREFPPEGVPGMAHSALGAMAALHAVEWRSRERVWGAPFDLEQEFSRLDNLLGRPSLDVDFIARAPALRERLRAAIPASPRVGCVHGDFQWTNCLFLDGRLNGLIDWELSVIGAVLIDLGWFCLFSDPEAWIQSPLVPKHAPPPDALVDYYASRTGAAVRRSEARWFWAFAAYRFGVITAFNLMLHRRGKRPDPAWEDIASSGRGLFDRGLELLG